MILFTQTLDWRSSTATCIPHSKSTQHLPVVRAMTTATDYIEPQPTSIPTATNDLCLSTLSCHSYHQISQSYCAGVTRRRLWYGGVAV